MVGRVSKQGDRYSDGFWWSVTPPELTSFAFICNMALLFRINYKGFNVSNNSSFSEFYRPTVDAPIDGFPVHIFPLKERYAAAILESGYIKPNDPALTPNIGEEIVVYALEKLVIPVSERLAFLGLGLPQIRVKASWAHVQLNHVPVESDIECIDGRICLPAFCALYSLICCANGVSQKARERYEDAFIGETIRIEIDADANAVHLRMQSDLADALNDGFYAWSHGR